MKTLTFLLAALFALIPIARGQETMNDSRMEWFSDARYGMFIHWGLYAVPAGEWKGEKASFYAEWIMKQANIPSSEYEPLAEQFNPVKFDADAWVATAKAAGMKYIVITAKHHDGFCMFDSKLTDYDIVDRTPWGKDPIKRLAAACRKAGLVFCVYYSVPDWHHPSFPAEYSQGGFHGDASPEADLDVYVDYMKGQVRELLTNYGPIGILWFDGGGSFKGQPKAELLHAQEIIDMIHELQPNCLVNNRLGLPADYGTPEQSIPGARQDAAFEVCMTTNGHWGYNKSDEKWKTPTTIVQNLVDITSKGGNYLLNVGPKPDGTFPQPAIDNLTAAGDWILAHGETIYGAGPSPWPPLPWGRVTTAPGVMYLHVFDTSEPWITLPGLKNKTRRAYVFGDEAKRLIGVRADKDGVRVQVPGNAVDPIDTVLVLEIEGEPKVVVPPPRPLGPRTDGVIELPATRASIVGETAHLESKGGRDNIGFWTNPKDAVRWEFEIRRPGTYAVEVDYACPAGTEGSRFIVAVGTEHVQGTVESTGSFEKFATKTLGEITLSPADRYTLTVQPTSMPHGAVMNLAEIRLLPR